MLAAFGLGPTELVVVLLMLGVLCVPTVGGVALAVYLLVRKSAGAGSPNRPQDAIDPPRPPSNP